MANNSKKWYNYFVSVEGEGATEPASPQAPGSGGGDAARAVAEIAAAIKPAAEAKLAAQPLPPMPPPAPAGSPPRTMEFGEIYAAAEIKPPTHGYTITKVGEMLANPHIKELPAEVKRSSVMVALEAAGVKIQEIIEDAVRRDRALDTFERIQQKQVEDFEAAKLEENRKLQAELDKLTAEYRGRMQANTEAAGKRKDAFYAWRVQKQIEEQKIADCVGYFVTENPITTAMRPAATPPAKPGSGD